MIRSPLVRWTLAITASLAAFFVTWYACSQLSHLDSGASWAIAGAVLVVFLAVLSWWAARTQNSGAQQPEPTLPAGPASTASAIGPLSQAVSGNEGVVISGDVQHSTIQVKTTPAKAAPRRATRPKLPSLSQEPPSFRDNDLPALELGLRERLLFWGPSGHPDYIGEPARSAALQTLNADDSALTGADSGLQRLMTAWYKDNWHAEPWELDGPNGAREANARWLGRAGARIARAQLKVELISKPDQALKSVTVTLHTLFINPYRPDPMEGLRTMFRREHGTLSGQGGEGSQAVDDGAFYLPKLPEEPPPFLHLANVAYLMFNMLLTLWGPLGNSLSAHIFGQELASTSELDAAIFTLPHHHGLPSSAREREDSAIPINKCIDFGEARLIPGATPRVYTLLDPISPDEKFLSNDGPEQAVINWLTAFSLENGYQDFDREITGEGA